MSTRTILIIIALAALAVASSTAFFKSERKGMSVDESLRKAREAKKYKNFEIEDDGQATVEEEQQEKHDASGK